MSEYLRPHQQDALRKLSNGKILYGGVGSGKTPVAVEYYMLREAPRDVYVITTARKRDSFDWQEEFYRVGVGPRSGPTTEVLGRKSKVRTDVGRDRASRDQAPGIFEEQVDGNSHHERSFRGDIQRLGTGSDRPKDGTTGLGVSDRTQRDIQLLGRSGEVSSVHAVSVSSHGSDIASLSGNDVEGAVGVSERLGRLPSEPGTYPYVLTVDSWNNIAKYADVAGAFFVFDEQRLVGSGDWTRKFLRIARRNHWILLSGTPGDTWMDYIPVFVANDFYKNRTEFKRIHVVYNTYGPYPKVDRYIDQGRLVRQRNQLLVHMPYERHTKRKYVDVPLQYDKELLDRVLKDRWHVYKDRPLNDVAEMFLVARKVVNSDPSRLEMVCELWKNHPRLIIFYNFNYELDSLRSLAEYYGLTGTKTEPSSLMKSSGTKLTSFTSQTATVAMAEWNGQKHQPVPTTDRWLYFAQYTAAAEAWNCITTDAMIMYSQNYSWKITQQSYGRIDRLNTPFTDLWYYIFMTDSFIDKAIRRSLDAKENFNVNKYSKMFS